MKKSLLALAVLGAFAGAAQAQSSVSVSGIVDMGYKSINPEGAANDTAGMAGSNSSTSTVVLSGTEDLGGGMKAGFFLASDFSMGTGGAAGSPTVAGFVNSQNFVSLGGGFGEIKLGNVNSQALVAAVTAQPFGTAIGGGYSADFSRLDGITVSGGTFSRVAVLNGNAGARPIRTQNSAYYSTPNFSGFQATAGISFENEDATGTTSFGMEELAVSYRANGVNAVLAHYKTTAGTTSPSAALLANSDIKQTLLGANYTFGPATVYAGWTTSKSGGAEAGNVNSSSYNVAGKYAITPAMALMANITRVNDKTGANADRSQYALGGDYSLSKRTTAYARLEKMDRAKNVAGGKRTIYALGLRHTF